VAGGEGFEPSTLNLGAFAPYCRLLSGAHAGKPEPVSFSRKQLAAQPTVESLNFRKNKSLTKKTKTPKNRNVESRIVQAGSTSKLKKQVETPKSRTKSRNNIRGKLQ